MSEYICFLWEQQHYPYYEVPQITYFWGRHNINIRKLKISLDNMYVIPWIVMMTCTDGDILKLTNVCNCWMISSGTMTGSHRSPMINIFWVLRLYERWESLKSLCCFRWAFVEKFMSKKCVCVCVCVCVCERGPFKSHRCPSAAQECHTCVEGNSHTRVLTLAPNIFCHASLWKTEKTSLPAGQISVHHVHHVLFFYE